MANFVKSPVYQYDEPAIYNQFSGGINIANSSEDMADNEILDGVNITYNHLLPSKRKGAESIARLTFSKVFKKIQGSFFHTIGEETFLIVAADGELHYSLYIPGVQMNLEVLPIRIYTSAREHNGKDLSYNLERLTLKKNNTLKSEGYILEEPDINTNYDYLIFQNFKDIEAAPYQNKLYIATGTRFIEVVAGHEFGELIARVIQIYEPSSQENKLVGFNILSPYPSLLTRSSSDGAAVPTIDGIKIKINLDDPETCSIEAIMSYPAGRNSEEFKFKWQYKKQGDRSWSQIEGTGDFSSDSSTGNILLARESLEDIAFVRCLFSEMEAFETDEDENKITGDDGDWVPNKLIGIHGAFTTQVSYHFPAHTAPDWEIIHSCVKILADGNKFLLYDDRFKTGQWFKTVRDKPGYITHKGGLNFKTNKDEQIIKAVHFKGVKVVFSHHYINGGNISIVTGDGDDLVTDNYSPYIRRIANTEISCDNADTVQIAENLLLFKHRNEIYAIEGSSLSSEIISVYSLNDKLLNPTRETFEIPWREPCVSEITSDYYALIWKEKISYENEEVFIERPAMRLKMYYKIGQDIGNRVFFPWLRDEGSVFNVDKIIYIDGISTHLHEMELVQYNKPIYTDLGKPYPCRITTKGFPLNYPKLVKMLSNTLIDFKKGRNELTLKVKIKNEAGHLLVNSEKKIKNIARDGAGSGTIGSTTADSVTYNAEYGFPLLLTTMEIQAESDDSFAFSGVTFNYRALDIPLETMYEAYSKVVRKGTPFTSVKKRVFSASSQKEEKIGLSKECTFEDFIAMIIREGITIIADGGEL